MFTPTPRLVHLGLGLLAVLGGCTEEESIHRLSRALSAICSVEVIDNGTSLGVKDVEQDYLPNVVNCESGDLATEALKAQAVLSRTYVYYKLAGGGTMITSGTSVQVYNCQRKIYLAQKHYDAVNATAGQILIYQGAPIWPCFNAGVSPTVPPCTPKTGVGADTCCTSNAGKSGSGITQSPCGYVDPTNYKNRGCACQNGSDCYATQLGKTYTEIIKAYFGDDIGWLTVTGSCIKPKEAGPVKLDGQPPVKKDGPKASSDSAKLDGQPPVKKDGPRPSSDSGSPSSDRAVDLPGPVTGDGRTGIAGDCSCHIGDERGAGARALSGVALLGLLGLALRRRHASAAPQARRRHPQFVVADLGGRASRA